MNFSKKKKTDNLMILIPKTGTTMEFAEKRNLYINRFIS